MNYQELRNKLSSRKIINLCIQERDVIITGTAGSGKTTLLSEILPQFIDDYIYVDGIRDSWRYNNYPQNIMERILRWLDLSNEIIQDNTIGGFFEKHLGRKKYTLAIDEAQMILSNSYYFIDLYPLKDFLNNRPDNINIIYSLHKDPLDYFMPLLGNTRILSLDDI